LFSETVERLEQRNLVSSTSRNRTIAILIPSLRAGGAERAMLLFATELMQRGYSVDLVVNERGGVLEQILPQGVRVVNLRGQRAIRALPGLIRYLNSTKPLVLYATIMHMNVIAALAGRLSNPRTPVVVRESNAPVSEPKRTFSRWMTYKLLPIAYRWTRGVIAVSDGVAHELREVDKKLVPLVRVIGTPVISEEVLRQGAEPIMHPWFQEGEPPVVLGAARLQSHKGFLTLIRAFAKVRSMRPARLVILGEGPDRERLEREVRLLAITEHVSLPGFVSNPFPYMRSARVFVLASEYEGLPNVLIQAMAFGTPVVATNCRCGPSEILEGGRYGSLVPVGDVDAMATAIERLLAAPSRREAARLSVIERFGTAKTTSAYLSVAGIGA